MKKTFVGPQLRQLRRDRGETQAEMAKALGVSATYVNLLENNQRSLSVQMLMALSDAYEIDWRDMVQDEASNRLADLRNVVQDPFFSEEVPDLQELRAALDHSPRLVACMLKLHRVHRSAMEKLMRQGTEQGTHDLLTSSPEAIIHEFFRGHQNYFDRLETAAERIRAEERSATDEVYYALKKRLRAKHGITVETKSVEDMSKTLRVYDHESSVVYLSEALDHQNRVFQLAHVLCLVEFQDLLDALTAESGIDSDTGLVRCHVELANYFAAAYLMPYEGFLGIAEATHYDVDRIAAAFNVSFEQVCHRLTTMQRPGKRGVPFFFLRIDKAGNVTKRFNSTSFNLAEYGGACPVWNIHTAFRTPGVILPQFVEMPDGERFFTVSRTTDRPVFSRETQDRRLAVALGCELRFAERIGYASTFNLHDNGLFSPIGINCHLCQRQACSQRAHQPLFMELPIDPRRRDSTRYES
ncbi:MAG: short-chain fatty acyl-CoA regulator family protein [Flavobacteriaceae bacterium]